MRWRFPAGGMTAPPKTAPQAPGNRRQNGLLESSCPVRWIKGFPCEFDIPIDIEHLVEAHKTHDVHRRAKNGCQFDFSASSPQLGLQGDK